MNHLKKYLLVSFLFCMANNIFATENERSKNIYLSIGISSASNYDRLSIQNRNELVSDAFTKQYLFNALTLDLGFSQEINKSIFKVKSGLFMHLSSAEESFSGYFSVPLLIGPEIGNKVKFSFFFGPHFGYLYTSGRIDEVREYDYGFIIQPQLSFKVSKNVEVLIGAFLQHGMRTVEKIISSSKTGDRITTEYQFNAISPFSIGVAYLF